MENENEEVIIAPEEELDDVEESEDSDTTDWKAEALKARAIAKRLKTKSEKAKTPAEAPSKKEETTSSELDYGQKAFLRSYDIKGADEVALVKTFMARTGDDLDSIVEDDIFQAKLANLREVKATKQAIPTGTKRSGQSPRTEVEYWLEKPFSEVPQDMRSSVLKAKISNEKNTNIFSSNAIVEG